jgi:hypothetical protein
VFNGSDGSRGGHGQHRCGDGASPHVAKRHLLSELMHTQAGTGSIKPKKSSTKESSQTSPTVVLSNFRQDGFHVRSSAIEDHIVPVTRMIAVHKSRCVALGQGREVHLVPKIKSPRPNLSCHHTPKQQVLNRLGLLIAKLAGCKSRESPTLQPIGRPTPISKDGPRKELAAIEGPRTPDLGNRGIPGPTGEEGAVG